MRIIGIDPGKTGAIAIVDTKPFTGLIIHPLQTDSLEDLRAQFQALFDGPEPYRVFVEDVGKGMPGNSSSSMTVFARHNGHLDAFLAVYCDLECLEYVRPVKWMDRVIGPDRPKGKGARDARKRYILDMMVDTWGMNLSLSSADAVAIATYGQEVCLTSTT